MRMRKREKRYVFLKRFTDFVTFFKDFCSHFDSMTHINTRKVIG